MTEQHPHRIAGVEIEALVGEDGQPIPNFPATIQAAQALDSASLNSILERLGISMAGSLAARKEWFLMNVGLISVGW